VQISKGGKTHLAERLCESIAAARLGIYLYLVGVGTYGEFWEMRRMSTTTTSEGEGYYARERSPLNAWLVSGAIES
jgi:hypothetical protein